MRESLFYTGVGSRSCPHDVSCLLATFAEVLELKGYGLRSGAADGADAAFESGVKYTYNKEIWVPWLGFNNHKSKLTPSDDAYILAATIHPVWNSLTKGAKSLHARNCHQVLGTDLNTKSKFVLCWTEGGQVKGGTATAIRLATKNNIPVLNFGKWTELVSMIDAFEDFLILNGEYNEV